MKKVGHPIEKILYIVRLLSWMVWDALKLALCELTQKLIKNIRRRPDSDRIQPISGERAGLLDGRDFVQINEAGFGDRWNTWVWSMKWWQGKLYAGTNRAFPCVEQFIVHSGMPHLVKYPPRFEPDIQCTDSPYDLPLQAEIWCYTPETKTWERVYQSPNEVEVPSRPGTFVARDFGFRNMVIYNESDGTEALYVSGVSTRAIDSTFLYGMKGLYQDVSAIWGNSWFGQNLQPRLHTVVVSICAIEGLGSDRCLVSTPQAAQRIPKAPACLIVWHPEIPENPSCYVHPQPKIDKGEASHS